MTTREENDLLVRTSAEQPMGRLLRRYWIPALLSAEIPEPEAPPVQVRLLGEDLVAFRNSEGRIGLLGEHCLHRGTSLFYGRNEDAGLRCIYHGWKYDVEGHVLDTPAEPVASSFKQRLLHTAYPTREINGIVFAYLGREHPVPLFPAYEWTLLPQSRTYVTKCLLDCSFLQGLEGECDAAHTSFLHSGIGGANQTGTYSLSDRSPRYEVEKVDFGLRLRAYRRAEPGREYVRTTAFVMPLSCSVAVGSVNAEGKLDGYETHFYVPIDDQHAWRFDFGFRRTQPLTERDLHRRTQIQADFRRVRRADNQYLQDREVQKTKDYTGIDDFLNEDACATESMGPIMDRTREHLGASDIGVVSLRGFLLDALYANERGETPPHVVTDPEKNDFRHAASTAEVIDIRTNA